MQILSDEDAARVVPRPAATTLIVRDGEPGLEVLMVRRSLQASFLPGAYVFPGGAVDAQDASDAHVALCDEPAERLIERIGNVTGVGAAAPGFAVAALRECFEECGLWLGAPAESAAQLAPLRARLHAGEPLAALALSADLPLATAGLMQHAASLTELPAVHPRVRIDAQRRVIGVLMPGQAGYDDVGLRQRA